ncbi:DUF4392 domain-containing protein [Dehalococcoidia bacterium]|nr:DUF4392 domain-containing protein [Dehalococcoidia bacterium]
MDAPKKEISKIIESIVLQDDFRGMTALSPHMKKNYIDSSSNLLLKTQGEIMIITGFYIIDAKASETDGPPGAVAISNALKTLGFSTSLVTDKYSYEIVKAISDETEVIEFPITDHRESAEFAKNLLSERNVGALISIERAGLVGDGTYRNWKGVDISPYNAKIDHLFDQHPRSIGIGDGGNEIGMGNLKTIIPGFKNLPDNPCVTTTTELIISSCSNWGGYGLVADLSIKTGKNLLPTIEEAYRWVKTTVEHGAVEGMSAEHKDWVDGRDPEADSVCLRDLNKLLNSNM